jgi:hypothetical protein
LNYFVAVATSSTGSQKLDRHFHFSNQAILDDPNSLFRAVELQLGEDLQDFVDVCTSQISIEYRRRMNLDSDRTVKREKCSELWHAALSSRSTVPTVSSPLNGLAPAAKMLLASIERGHATVGDLTALRLPNGRPCLEKLHDDGDDNASGVWAFELFDPEYCRETESFLAGWASACGDTKSRPNSMNRHGVLLDEVEDLTQTVSDPLLAYILRPLATVLFPQDGGATLDHHRTFSVVYRAGNSGGDSDAALPTSATEIDWRKMLVVVATAGLGCLLLSSSGEKNGSTQAFVIVVVMVVAGLVVVTHRAPKALPETADPLLLSRSKEVGHEDAGLSTHFDNSEVTLNVNIGGEWAGGGELVCLGAADQGPAGRRDPPVVMSPRLGFAVIHRGQELHGARPISTAVDSALVPQSASRTNLVLWARSSHHRENVAGCPMCGLRSNVVPLHELLSKQQDEQQHQQQKQQQQHHHHHQHQREKKHD